MKLKIDVETKKKMTIEQVVEHFNNVDVNCQKALVKNAWVLKAFANNKEALANFLLAELKKPINEFQKNNYYTPPSLILGFGNNFYIRANLWQPNPVKKGNKSNIYGLCHDHNFDFLTVGYYGPGYKTRIYNYDYNEVKGEIGEKVSLQFVDEYQLNEGDVFFYRKGQHVHSQIEPDSLSISVNLIVSTKDQNLMDQYIFDEATKKISSYSSCAVTSRDFLFKIGQMLGDNKTKELLREVAQSFPCKRTRKSANIAIEKMGA